MRKVQLLWQLQQVDDAIERERVRLAGVTAELQDRTALTAIESEHAEATALVRQKSAQQRDLELETEDLRQKLQALEAKLYGGTVRNPKELNDMAQEAQQFRSLISTREDRLIELYDVVEAATRGEATVSTHLEQARAELSETIRNLEGERDELEVGLAAHRAERENLEAAADRQALRLYDSLRRTRGGLAVARVAQRTCQGCRVTIPAHLESRARSGDDLVTCQSCGRILYAGL